MNYAETLAYEVEQNPEQAAAVLLRLSTKICDRNISKVLDTLNSLKDGTKASEISGVPPADCAACVDLLRDAMMLPVILHTLKKKGLMLALPNNPSDVPPTAPPPQGSPMRQQADFIWTGMTPLEGQIKSLCAFQVETDQLSAYGQLILKLAGAALYEINARK